MIPSSKHSREFNGILTRFLKGLNKTLPAQAIDAEELTDATNFFYDPLTGYLTSRPGLKRHSLNAAGAAVNGIYDFVKNGVSTRLVTTADDPQKLYFLDGANTAQLIGDLNGTKRPSFATVNGKCQIASGATLQVYDGTTLEAITVANGYPADAPSLDFVTDTAERDVARVLGCGNTTYRDQLFMSGIKDGTWWKRDSVGNPETDAKYMDAGYGDGQDLIGIGPFQGDVILFKRTPDSSMRALYRGIIGGVSSSWSCPRYRQFHSCLSPHMVKETGDGLLFVDVEGPKVLKIADQPTDNIPYSVSPASRTIGGEMTRYVTSSGFIINDPVKNLAMAKPSEASDTFYCMDFYGNRWTYFIYGVDIRSGAYVGGKMLFGAADGYVYEYDDDLSKDNGVTYAMTVETKWFDIFPLYSELVKEKYLDFLALSTGTGNMIVKKKGALAYSKAFTFDQGWLDWTTVNALAPADWTEDLRKTPLTEVKDINVVQGDYMSIAVSVTTGRIALSFLATRTAQTDRK